MPNTRTMTSGTRSTPKAFKTLFHCVVRMNSTANETDVPTLNNKNRADTAPVRVITIPKGKSMRMGPGVMNSAGSATTPVKNGIKTQTRLIKNPNGTADTTARMSTQKYKTAMTANWWDRLTANKSMTIEITLRRGSNAWSNPFCRAIFSAKMDCSRLLLMLTSELSIKLLRLFGLEG